MSGRVFIIQDVAGRDFLPARRFGELTPLMPGNAQVVLSAAPAIRAMKAKLAKFNDDDYLVLVGDPILIGMAIKIAADANMGRVKVLKWTRRESDYVPVVVDFNEKGERFDC